MPSFVLNLVCKNCGAKIEFQDEKPEWKEDPEVAAAIAEAKAFVERHKDKLPCHVEEKKPALVYATGQYDEFKVLKVDPRYVDCPCCEGKAWFGSGKQAMA